MTCMPAGAYATHHMYVLQVPVHVVFGLPIELPRIDSPSADQIHHYLQLYIEAMEALCEKHKHRAGYGSTLYKVV